MKIVKYLHFFVLLKIFFLNDFVIAKETNCIVFLNNETEETTELDSTQATIAYLNYLVEQRIVTKKELEAIAEQIKNSNKLSNPVPDKAGDSAYQIHRANFEQYLVQPDLDLQQIYAWALSHVEKTQQVQQKKEETQGATQLAAIPMRFNRIEKGEFYWGSFSKIKDFLRRHLNYEKNKKVILTHDIEVMSTPVTQWMWTYEMGENPSIEKEGRKAIEVNIHGNLIKIQPDHPVENITWYAAAMFANHISRKYGFKEVYDFTGVSFKKGTTVEAGNLDIESGEVKISGPTIYETEGYRLPTEAEQRFLLRDRGRSTGKYFTGVTEENLHQYSWKMGSDNPFGKVHTTYPVAEKKPMVIDGKDFFDLYGNVLEWSNDWADDTYDDDGDTTIKRDNEKSLRHFGVNPEGLMKGNIRVLRGAHGKGTSRSWGNPGQAFGWYGFRLVRTVK